MASHNFGPVMYTPLTKVYYGWFNFMQFTECAPFDLDRVRCLNKYGIAKGEEICWREIADFHECVTKTTEFKRYFAMRKERQKQGKEYEDAPVNYVNPSWR